MKLGFKLKYLLTAKSKTKSFYVKHYKHIFHEKKFEKYESFTQVK